jgi:protein-tyrosine phosphatase
MTGVINATDNIVVRSAVATHVFDIASLIGNVDALEEMLTFARDVLSGGRLLVHCRAGRHRAASTVACILIHLLHMTASEAIHRVHTARPISDIKWELRDYVVWASKVRISIR